MNVQAKPGVVDDALMVLQNWPWPGGMEIPESVMVFDGSAVIEIYDEKGFTKGGVEFVGKHRAVYTVVSGSKVLGSGTFDASSQREIKDAMQTFFSLQSS